MKRPISFTLAGVLAALLVAQMLYRPIPVSVVQMGRENPPADFEEVLSRSQDVVLADVVKVSQGPDFVAPIEGQPSEFHRVPSQRIIVQVVKTYKGSSQPGQTLILYQDSTGVTEAQPAPGETPVKVFLQSAGNPLYQVSERYLLALRPVVIPAEIKQYQPEPWHEDLMTPTFMEGRILVEQDGSVKIAGEPGYTKAVEAIDGKRFDSVDGLVLAAVAGGQ